ERSRLLRSEGGDRIRVLGEEDLVVGDREGAVDGLEVAASRIRLGPQLQQLVRGDRVPLDAVEEPEGPRALGEEATATEAVPDLHGAADELVAARPLHPVDAEVRAPDPYRILRGPGACRVVLGRHQSVPGVERSRDR